MKKTILPVLMSVLWNLSALNAQTPQSAQDLANKCDTQIILIKSNQIPSTVKKTLSKDYKGPRKNTVYLDNATQSYVIFDQQKKKTYIYKKNSGMMLELRPGKNKIEKTPALANK